MFNPRIPNNISKLRVLSSKANQQTINLTVGNPIDSFPIELSSYFAELKEFQLGYSPNAGDLKLRTAIAQKFGYEASEIVITNGAQGGLMNVLMGLIESGVSKVALPNPGFLAYPTMVNMLGGIPEYYHYQKTDSGEFTLSVDQFVDQISGECRIVLINTPSNPTGHSFTRAEMMKLKDWAEETNRMIVIDEVYGELNYQEEYFPQDYKSESIVSVSSVSKSHALSGIRLGWALCKNEKLIKATTVVQQYYNTCTSSLAQGIGSILFRDSELYQTISNRYANLYFEKIHRFFNLLKLDHRPSSAFYGFLPVRLFQGQDVEAFCFDLLEKENLLVVPGSYFGSGGEQSIRVSLSIEDRKLEKAALILKNYLV